MNTVFSPELNDAYAWRAPTWAVSIAVYGAMALDRDLVYIAPNGAHCRTRHVRSITTLEHSSYSFIGRDGKGCNLPLPACHPAVNEHRQTPSDDDGPRVCRDQGPL